MARRLPAHYLGVAAALVAVWSLAADQTPSTQGPVFRGGVTFVSVDVYPRRDGRVVEGLTRADFEVLEDGKPQAIESFDFVRIPPASPGDRVDPRHAEEAERWVGDPRRRVIIVYLDIYHMSRAGSLAVKAPLIQFLNETIGPADLFAVMTPEISAGSLIFARTLNTLVAEIDRYFAYGVGDEKQVILRTPAEVQLAACGDPRNGYNEIIRRFRDLGVYTSLESLITRLGALRQERTSVVFLSEGLNTPRGGVGVRDVLPRPGQRFERQFGLPGPDTGAMPAPDCRMQLLRLNSVDFEERFRALLLRANAANVAFYPISPGGLSVSGPSRAATMLQTLAENTDGVATIESNDFARAYRRVTDDLAAYYLLGYNSNNLVADGKYRRIEVRVRQRGLDVTARRGYLGPSAPLQRAADVRTASAAVPTPVADALGELSRWRDDAEAHVRGIRTRDGVTIVVELARRLAASTGWVAGSNVRVELVGPGGRTHRSETRILPGGRATTLRVPLDAGDVGPWQAHVQFSGESVETTSRATIAPLAEGPIDAHLLFAADQQARAPWQPAAAPLIRRGDRWRVEWFVAGVVTNHAVRILDRRGQPLTIGAGLSSAVDEARKVLSVELHSAALGEGDYVLELTTRSADQPGSKLVAFRISR